MNDEEVQSLAEAQQRSMKTTAAEMNKMVDLIREFGNDELRLQMEDSRRKVLEGFAVVVESSIPTMKGINFSNSSSSISVYKNLHQLGSLLKCVELREATAMMLGALTLAPDMDIFEIEYLANDLVKAFSSPVFPYLYSEDQFYKNLEDAMKSFGEDESGVSEDLKFDLILTLDWNNLSESKIELLEDFIDGYHWKDKVLRKLLRNSNESLQRKRTFKFSDSITLTRSDLSNERINSLVSSFFEINPHVQCVLDISSKWYKGKTLSIDKFPSSIRHLSFTNCEKYSSIGNDFLRDSYSLISVDFSGFKNVTTIGGGFLSSCESLEVVDLSGLNNLTTINEYFFFKSANGFMENCEKLESVDLCSFDKVTVIGDNFLYNCKSLKDISNMSGLSNVKSIGNYFLARCESLVSVDASALKSVTAIDKGFLNFCLKLESVDLRSFDKITVISDDFLYKCESLKDISNMSGLSNVKSIGNHFLAGCESLVSVDASALKSVTAIDKGFLNFCLKLESVDLRSFDKITVISDDFLYNCKSLKDISNMSGLSNVKSIGNYFLAGCESLVSVDASALKSVTAIDEGFLNFCLKLESVDLRSFDKITVISVGFLCGCESLKDISNMSGLSNVKSIGNHFLAGCDSLVSVDASALKSVTAIDKGFLNSCLKLESVDLRSFDKITVISDDFLYKCESLKDISNMSGLSNVKSIGNYFLAGCESLVSVDASALKSVTSIDDGFLMDCEKLESVDLCGFDKITVINENFLYNCKSLKDISNMSGLSNVKSIGNHFLAGCESLVSVDAASLKSMTSIDDGFLMDCEKLESVDLRSFDKITVINDNFLGRCESLKDISNMSGLGNVKSIGNNFLAGCDSLVSVDASALKSRLLSEPPMCQGRLHASTPTIRRDQQCR